MENNFDFLENINQDDKQVLKNLSTLGEKLKSLKAKMLETEAAADLAKKEYEHFANVLMPQEMFSCGLSRVDLSSGGSIKLKHNFYCQPNKNVKDKETIAAWLRANGGEYLIKSNAVVSLEDKDKLVGTNIPFIEDISVNTASLKAFLKDKIGATTGIQQIKVEDIPACIHFQEVTTVELED